MKISNSDNHRIEPITHVRIPITRQLYRRVESAARENGCAVTELIVSALETGLPPLPDGLPPELTTDLQRWAMLDDQALLAIANAFLPAPRRRRYSTLLRKAKTDHLDQRELAEWEALQREYLRVSQNKAKAQFLLVQRKKASLGELSVTYHLC